MPRRIAALSAISLLSIGTATAEVVSAGAGGFLVEHDVVVSADRGRVWQAAVDEVGSWWNDDHTVSGDATRLHIVAEPLGCFCEQLAGEDGVVHLVVTSVSRNVMLRMSGGLGPLGLMGVSGNMTWELFDTDDEGATRVRFTYAVGGYSPDGLDTLAGPVDRVIGDALLLLKKHTERAVANEPRRD